MTEDFQQLVSMLARSVDEVGRARTQLYRNSLGSPSVAWLGPVRFAWRYQIARREGRVEYLLAQRAPAGEVVVDARLEFQLHAVPGVGPGAHRPHSDSAPELRLRVPPMFAPPVDSAPRIIRVALDGTADDVLEITPHDDDPGKAGLRWLRDGAVTSLRIQYPDMRTPVWNLAPFIAWLEVARTGRERPESSHHWESIELDPPAANTRPVSHLVVENLVELYRRATAQSNEAAAPAGTHPAIAWRQTLDEYRGLVGLRLRRDALALAGTDEANPLALDLAFRVVETTGRPRLELQVALPDLLVEGDLHRAILAALAAPASRANGDAKYHLGDSVTRISEEDLQRAFQRNGAGATIQRIGRQSKEIDSNLILLRARIGEYDIALLFLATLRIRRKVGRDSIAHYTAEVEGDPVLLSPYRVGARQEYEGQRARTVGALVELMVALSRCGGLRP